MHGGGAETGAEAGLKALLVSTPDHRSPPIWLLLAASSLASAPDLKPECRQTAISHAAVVS